MPVYQTYQAIGRREDLLDVIVNITPTESPFFSACKKTKASQTFHEWQTDTLATAATNAVVEGVDDSMPLLSPTTRLGNYVQTMNKVFWVSHDQEAVSKAGRDSEYAYQAEKKMKELVRDTEFELIRETSASGASGTARTLNGLFAAISTNTSTAAQDRPLSQSLFDDMCQTIADAGGNPGVVYAASFQRRQISAFSGPQNSQRNIAAADKRLINSVSIYEGDFGLYVVIYDRHINAGNIAIVEQAMWRVAVLRPTKHYPLPDSGGGPRGKIEHALTLEYGNEAASGEILNLTTS